MFNLDKVRISSFALSNVAAQVMYNVFARREQEGEGVRRDEGAAVDAISSVSPFPAKYKKSTHQPPPQHSPLPSSTQLSTPRIPPLPRPLTRPGQHFLKRITSSTRLQLRSLPWTN
ncbi:hypothetical protein BGX27_008207 [Mortierella sp. AM989]|nr:hypothetical protein BGX27_008207 [Mortierella sp. AM989]